MSCIFKKYKIVFVVLLLSLLAITSNAMAVDCAALYKEIKSLLAQPEAKKAAVLTKKLNTLDCDTSQPEYLRNLNNLALLHDHLHDYALAERLYKKALQLVQKRVGLQHPDYAQQLDNLAHLYMDSAAFKHAEEVFQQALSIRKKALGENHPDYGHSLNNLAGLYYQHGDNEKAAELYDKATAIWQNHHGEEHPHYVTAINNQAWNHLESGDHSKALELFEHSLKKREQIHGEEGHHEIANTLTGLAHAHHQDGRPEKAESLLRRALPLLHHESHASMRWQVQHHFSQSLAAQGHIGAAVLFGKHALDSLHGLRHTSGKTEKNSHQIFLADKNRLYTEMVDLLMEQGRINESHHVMKMLREEELFDFLHRDKNHGIQHSSEPVYASHEEEWVNRYQALNQNLADLNHKRGLLRKSLKNTYNQSIKKQLKELEQSLASTRQKLEKYFDHLKEKFPDHAPLEKEDLQHLHQLQAELAKAGKGTVALHYMIGKDQLNIILTTKDKQISYQVEVKNKLLKHKIRSFRSAVQNLTKSPKLEAAALYQYLIAPIADQLHPQETTH